jgi:hypothetical protein
MHMVPLIWAEWVDTKNNHQLLLIKNTIPASETSGDFSFLFDFFNLVSFEKALHHQVLENTIANDAVYKSAGLSVKTEKIYSKSDILNDED